MSKYSKNAFRNLSALTLITQLGISVATPAVVMTLLGVWICDKTGVGSWLIAVFAILGVCAGMITLIRSLKIIASQISKDDETDYQKTSPDKTSNNGKDERQ